MCIEAKIHRFGIQKHDLVVFHAFGFNHAHKRDRAIALARQDLHIDIAFGPGELFKPVRNLLGIGWIAAAVVQQAAEIIEAGRA